MPDQNDHFHHKMGGPGQQQQHHHMNANHNRSGPSSQIGGVIQSTAALKDRSVHNPLGNNGSGSAPSCSFLGPGPGGTGLGMPPLGQAGGNGYYNMMSSNSNAPSLPGGSGPPTVSTASINNRPPLAAAGPVQGGGLHNMPPMVPLGVGAGGNDFGGLHIKDAKQLNSEVGKNGRDNLPGGVEASDLVKDFLLHAMQSNPVSMSPKRSSTLQTPVPPGQSPTRSRSPPASSSAMTAVAAAASLDGGQPVPPPAACVAKSFPLISANVPSTPEVTTPDVAGTTKTDSPPLRAPSTSPAAAVSATATAPAPVPSPSQSLTSNDDSADSNSSKSRRRRKPDRTSKMSSDELERMHDFLTSETSTDKCGSPRIDGIDPMRPNIAVRNDIATLALEGISSLSQGHASDSSHSPHITDLSDSTRINLQQTTTTTTTTAPTLNESNNQLPDTPRESPRIKSPAAAVSSVISSVLSAAAAMAESAAAAARKDSESTSDDCETIDKIAAMISSTEDDPLTTTPVSSNCNGPAAAAGADAAVPACVEGSSGGSKSESQHKPDADKSYEEIENKLEEMFAGIEESTPSCSKSLPTGAKKSPAEKQAFSEPATDILTELAGKNESESASATGSSNSPAAPVEADPASEPSTSGTQKKVLTPAAKRASAGKAGGTPPNKRKKVLKKKSAHGKGTSFAAAEERMANLGGGKAGKKPLTKGKKAGSAAGSSGGKNAKVKSNESIAATAADLNGKYKGPFVQVKSDGSHMVINAPINEDDSDKPQNKTKKFTNSMNNSEKSKIRGLHVSTLSTKYDADTTDASWMCVFCKMGPHKMRLGDLFGPYIISTKSAEFAESKTDQEYFSEKRTRESLASKLVPPKVEPPQVATGSAAKSKKRKSQEPTATTSAVTAPAVKVPPPSSPVDMFYGMVKAGEDSYEVWMHEDCLVWAPGVYIIGTRIVGLEAAIWNCCRHQCRICDHSGAMVSCLRRGCNAEAHVVCARKHDWELNDEFKAHCKDHSEDVDS